jgi:hypothetical protein
MENKGTKKNEKINKYCSFSKRINLLEEESFVFNVDVVL